MNSLSTNMLKGHLMVSVLARAWLFCKFVLVLLGKREKDFGSTQVYTLRRIFLCGRHGSMWGGRGTLVTIVRV